MADRYPYRLIRHGDRSTTVTPEPGWSSQCTHPMCPGHWRTGLDSKATAERVYADHRCANGGKP
jgi:hypothetical protein